MAKRIATNSAKRKRLRTSRPEEQFLDDLILSQVRLLNEAEIRFVDQVAFQADEAITGLERELERTLPGGPGSVTRRRQLTPAIDRLQDVREQALSQAERATQAGASWAASTRAGDVTRATIALAADSGVGTAFGVLSAQQIAEASRAEFLGADVSRWFRRRRAVGLGDLGRELRQSWLAGEGVDQAAARLRKVGVTDRREAITVARTTIQGASNRAAHELYREHSSRLRGMRWVGTLDNRTCPQCGPMDGRLLSVEKPVATPPLHPRCRCFLAPDVAAFPPLKVQPWDQWILRQPEETQEEILGLGRFQLIDSGAIEPGQLINERGELRSLRSLRRSAAGR